MIRLMLLSVLPSIVNHMICTGRHCIAHIMTHNMKIGKRVKFKDSRVKYWQPVQKYLYGGEHTTEIAKRNL